MAHVGFSVKDKPVGPAVLFQNLLKNDCEVVGTIICGDNYFAENIEHAVTEGVELVRSMKPDLLLPDLPIMPDVMGLAAVIWQQRWEGNWGYPQ